MARSVSSCSCRVCERPRRERLYEDPKTFTRRTIPIQSNLTCSALPRKFDESSLILLLRPLLHSALLMALYLGLQYLYFEPSLYKDLVN
jgi:hypothetical protein